MVENEYLLLSFIKPCYQDAVHDTPLHGTSWAPGGGNDTIQITLWP